MAIQTALFGDEAFYWLESRFLQWSYSEIPGFVPWLNALSTALLPQHPFFLRLPFLLACWSLPWLAFLLAKQISRSHQAAWQAALFSLIVPLIGLMGVLAIADVWLLFFTLLTVLLWLRLKENHHRRQALLLGLCLMLAVNVHIRFWFILCVALLAAAVIYKQQLLKIKPLWQITLPLTFVGFIPILIFNVQHDFPLLSFQLGERNPWQFQLSHLWFFLGQIVITTPLVFYLCLVSLKRPNDSDETRHQAIGFIQLFAVLYWLLYAILGFFSDNLRTNIHWPVPSYLLLLIVAASFFQSHQKLKQWAVLTGGLAHGLFLIGFYILLHVLPVNSNSHKQLINNAIGWPQLAAKVKQLQQPEQLLIADNFMTAATLNYYLEAKTLIASLPHPMNGKHGRQTQLAMMDLLYRDTPNQAALVVVEHTALKLPQQIPFYQQSCQQLNGLRLVDDLSLRQGSKVYYFFHTNAGTCEIPPIVYHDYQQDNHRGWVVVDKNLDVQISYQSPDGQFKLINTQTEPLGQNRLFNGLDSQQYHRLSYQLESDETLQLDIKTNLDTISTQRFYP